MDKIREGIEKLIFGYLDLSERAQDPSELIDKITTLISKESPLSVPFNMEEKKRDPAMWPYNLKHDIYVSCNNCAARGEWFGWFESESKEKATRVWNITGR